VDGIKDRGRPQVMKMRVVDKGRETSM